MKQSTIWLKIIIKPTLPLSLVIILAKFISVVFSLWAFKWIGCNVHEFFHFASAYLLGIPIIETSWCGPGISELSGEVVPRFTENSIRFTVFYGSGGVLTGAIFLVAILYVFATINTSTKSKSWHITGVFLTMFAATQILFGLYEGADHVAYQQGTNSGTFFFIGPFVGILLYAIAIRKTEAFSYLSARKSKCG